MKYYSTIYRQLLNIIPTRKFRYEAEKGRYNRYTKHFTVWNQFLVNLYAQASSKKSLRDIETGLSVHRNHWYHLGLKNISRSQLSYVNNRNSYQIFQNLFYQLLSRCLKSAPDHEFRFKNPLKILDSTTIDLCLSVFPWAKFRKTKGALKIHTLLESRGTIPSFLVITDAKQHDVKVAKNVNLPLSPDSILVMDRAYLDFKWLYSLDKKGIFFVTMSKTNMDYKVLGQHKQIKDKSILSDEIIKLTGYFTSPKYPDKLRLVKFYDQENDKILTFITNNFDLLPTVIARIYKTRWKIESFFKWIKQNLKIKTFLGTSKNAVMTQIWTAMIYYLLLSYIKFQTKYKYSLLKFTRIFKESLFIKKDIIDLLNLNPDKLKNARDPCVQMNLFYL
ncbi:MAG: IS4 family transposase [bacterium]